MNSETDAGDLKSKLRPSITQSEADTARQNNSEATDIGNITGLTFRAPSIGDSAFSTQTRNYLETAAFHYSTDEFNKLIFNEHSEAITNATGNFAVAIGYGISGTAQIGLFYPLIGFGPYFAFSLTGGLTSTGDRFFQFQWSLGGGMGTFLGVGASQPFTFHGKLKEGKSEDNRFELNVGLVQSASASVNLDKEIAITASPMLGPKFSWGEGVGFSAAVVHSETNTWINPDIQMKEYWNDFSTSVGREMHEIEIQLYHWSRMMEP